MAKQIHMNTAQFPVLLAGFSGFMKLVSGLKIERMKPLNLKLVLVRFRQIENARSVIISKQSDILICSICRLKLYVTYSETCINIIVCSCIMQAISGPNKA